VPRLAHTGNDYAAANGDYSLTGFDEALVEGFSQKTKRFRFDPDDFRTSRQHRLGSGQRSQK
jgi:hypothetical protein